VLAGTLIAGTVSETLGVIPVLNLQAAGKLLAGVLALALLPRMLRPRKNAADILNEPAETTAPDAQPV
jgi:hypothetical protein